jgi:hypothetical protein
VTWLSGCYCCCCLLLLLAAAAASCADCHHCLAAAVEAAAKRIVDSVADIWHNAAGFDTGWLPLQHSTRHTHIWLVATQILNPICDACWPATASAMAARTPTLSRCATDSSRYSITYDMCCPLLRCQSCTSVMAGP